MANTKQQSLQSKAKKILEDKNTLSPEEYLHKLEQLALEVSTSQNPQDCPPQIDKDLCQIALETLPNSTIFILDRDYKYIFTKIDKKLEKLYSVTPTTGKSLHEIFPKGQLTFQIEKAKSVFSGLSETFERNIGGRVYQIFLSPIKNPKGEVTHALSLLRDVTDKKMAQQAINEGELKYKSMLESLSQVVFLTDPDGHWTFLNPAWKRVTGYPVEKSLGKKSFQYFTKNDAAIIEDRFGELMNKKIDSFKHSISIQTNIGEIREIEISALRTIGRLGRVTGTVGTISDVTEYKATQRMLLQQEERFRRILEIMPDIILMQNSEFVYTDAHIPDQSLALMQPEKFLGKKMDDVVPPFLAELFFEAFEKTKNDGKPHTFEYELDLKSKHGFFEARIVALPQKQILTIVRDITERKLSETRLREAEKRWSSAFLATQDGIWDWNIATGNVYFSDTWKEMLGYAPTSFENSFEQWDKLLHPDDSEAVYVLLDNHLNGKSETFRSEHRLLCNNGNYKWVLSRGKIIEWDAKGAPLRFIGTNSDINENKLAEEALKQANITKDKFFSIISHDLRSPFNTLLGFTQMLYENYHELSHQKRIEYLSFIQQISSSTFNLLDNLLTWSRSQRGRMIFAPKQLPLSEIIDQQFGNFEFQSKQKSISLEHDIDDNVSVFADKNMLSTILRNLISNAIKFSREDSIVAVSAKQDTNYVEVSVKDTGIGIAPKDIEKLFRLDENFTTYGTSQEKGTGLGLILCKEFVDKNNGKIGVDSKLGKGTTFWFTIPLQGDNRL